MAILVGTSEFDYKDWRGPFYPRFIRSSERLAYCAEHFDTVELNVIDVRTDARGLRTPQVSLAHSLVMRRVNMDRWRWRPSVRMRQPNMDRWRRPRTAACAGCMTRESSAAKGAAGS